MTTTDCRGAGAARPQVGRKGRAIPHRDHPKRTRRWARTTGSPMRGTDITARHMHGFLGYLDAVVGEGDL
jgi:hypothetical protein